MSEPPKLQNFPPPPPRIYKHAREIYITLYVKNIPLFVATCLIILITHAFRHVWRNSSLPPPSVPPGLPTDIRSWTIEQVVKYFQFTPECRDYADIFHEQEVDGTALLLLTHESLVKCLGIKLGRALKIMMHVEELRKRFDVQNQ